MGSYDDALRERLNLINSIGEDQTTWERLHSARLREAQLQQQSLNQRQAQYNSMLAQRQNSQNIGANIVSGSPDFEAFKATIGRKESSNNYGAVNRSSGALGKYQIMPSNINGTGRGWDYEALGYDVSTSAFLKSPEIQEKVASYKLQQYYNKYGPAGASIAWYAGPSAAQKYANTGYVSGAAQSGGYPSVSAYMQAIMNGLGR